MSHVNADDALAQIVEGNRRYVADQALHPYDNAARRRNLVGSQKPFACILTCSDSRVPPEMIFDQGLGDLFVVRVAGNTCDDPVLGSLEFAVLSLGVKLVVVMGHRECGAVAAAVDHVHFDSLATHSHIDALIELIQPAVRRATGAADLLDASVRMNARMVAAQIRESKPVFARLAAEGVRVVPAHYDIESGAVDWLD